MSRRVAVPSVQASLLHAERMRQGRAQPPSVLLDRRGLEARRKDMPTRSKFIVEREDSDTVVISDVGGVCMSVTNDAEAVVRALHDQGVLRGRRLLYYDSEGRLDELKHDGHGNFTGFAPYTPDEG